MVDGINGIGSASGLDATELKKLIKEVVAEEIDTQKESAHKMMEQAYEEVGFEPEQKAKEEDNTNAFTSILTKLLDVIMAVFGGGNKDKVEDGNEAENANNNKETGEEKYKMSAGEEAYLKMNPDLVKNMIAEEKYQEKYGDKNGGLKAFRVDNLAKKVTDEEVQAYLQLNQNAIKDAMAADGIDVDDAAVNEPKTLNENEKAFMTLNPDFVKNLIAEEKYQEKYGDKNGGLKAFRVDNLAQKVTNEEIQAYLQLHPSVIKEAIAKG